MYTMKKGKGYFVKFPVFRDNFCTKIFGGIIEIFRNNSKLILLYMMN